MKQLFKKLQENARSIVEIIGLVMAFLIPYIINVKELIALCFENVSVDFDNIGYYLLLNTENWVISIVLVFSVLLWIRKFNKEKIFNTKNVYHNYPYLWYWFCAKILGYQTCNLKLVPPYLQFKLVLNDTFSIYYVGEEDDYAAIEDEYIEIKKEYFVQVSDEVNLVLADTYPIENQQLPIVKRSLSTITINRVRPDVSRYYSPQFIAKIVDEVRNLPRNVTDVNVFPTTNPRHTLKIARDAFKLAERGNIKKLVVFPQEKTGIRKFARKGKVIYNNK